ncbi:MAG TPA: HU family DNA-binding protein [Candidatus Hydrogenedens sp.]|nr:integration host factor subunit beta [Candidatus Hydrogenedens sp.]HOK08522.1 HU family DNA-binding protein [Candidatus Hydrogenedens sp.]HOL19010.1 HU family DNA-binding protein [Candidatus Hydrogenedens sp.]HPP57808.1 HU family DNA-binding protein [Candidatus Hydrogenedens sp.]
MEPGNEMQSNTMTKKDLVNLVSEKLGFTQSDVAKTIDTALEIIVNSLGKGKRWEIRNFGVFDVKKRAPRKGRNPKTGEVVEVPNRYVVTFKAGKELKMLIKNLSNTLNK